ncbi:hypothetical protein UPYG_G00077290 [Umbra pygmaea]|uniref:Uncharacterized protein n=1 Tax=Umbra pygmaea TaxID=75934 RepID=A0ABD0XUP2_UMBPY
MPVTQEEEKWLGHDALVRIRPLVRKSTHSDVVTFYMRDVTPPSHHQMETEVRQTMMQRAQREETEEKRWRNGGLMGEDRVEN